MEGGAWDSSFGASRVDALSYRRRTPAYRLSRASRFPKPAPGSELGRGGYDLSSRDGEPLTSLYHRSRTGGAFARATRDGTLSPPRFTPGPGAYDPAPAASANAGRRSPAKRFGSAPRFGPPIRLSPGPADYTVARDAMGASLGAAAGALLAFA